MFKSRKFPEGMSFLTDTINGNAKGVSDQSVQSQQFNRRPDIHRFLQRLPGFLTRCIDFTGMEGYRNCSRGKSRQLMCPIARIIHGHFSIVPRNTAVKPRRKADWLVDNTRCHLVSTIQPALRISTRKSPLETPRTSASCKVHSYAHISEFFHRLLEASRSHIIDVSHDWAVDDECVGGLVNLQLYFSWVQLKWNYKPMHEITWYPCKSSTMNVCRMKIE